MKTISPPIVVTVVASGGGSTNLATTAAAMSPGTWASMPASNQNAILGVGDVSGSTLQYAMSCAWNPQNKMIEIVGADHAYGYERYMRFDGNQFLLINVGDQPNVQPRDSVNGGNSGLYDGHEFNGLACNPTTGDCYYRRYGAIDSSRQPVPNIGYYGVGKCVLNGTDFRTNIPLQPVVDNINIVAGSCWWSGSLAGVGAQGAFMIYNCGNSAVPGGSSLDGAMHAFDPLSNTWPINQNGVSPFYGLQGPQSIGGTYHEIAAYSAVKNCMVYGGGNWQPYKCWRYNSDASFTAMPDLPVGANPSIPIAVGIQRGNLVADPVTGNFLLLSGSSPTQLWQLNPSGSGTWTQQTGTRTPPSQISSPGPAPGVISGIVSCAIPDYGVIAYIRQDSSSISAFYLYKHA
jgi:hypothetical protein